jgi:phenylalanyl-tRNA synthetase beta chain
MKFTYSWLLDHLETTLTPEQLVPIFVQLGLEVEGLENAGENLKPFVIAEILETTPHPQADRLKVCKVSTGKEIFEVVCGAPNARQGIKVVFAPVGTKIPKTGTVLKLSAIRGVTSHGMMCSSSELMLGEESGGILELPSEAPLGTSYADYLGLNDTIFDIGLTPNRSDALGVRGIALDLASAGYGKLKPLKEASLHGTFKSPIAVHLNFNEDAKQACPLFVGCFLKGVQNKESPLWLKKRLEAVGLRPISALVDITNYLTLDQARPLHVFDAHKIQGDLTVRFSKADETFEALDNKTYTLDEGHIVIADSQGVVSLAGVIGGARTGCSLETTDVFLEVALFDPKQVAATGRSLNILSDARYRFERGVDPESVSVGLHQATRLIQDICAGEVSKAYVAGEVPVDTRRIEFDIFLVNRLTGISVSTEDIQNYLTAFHFKFDHKDNQFMVTPPSYRPDLTLAADIVGDFLRVYGYEKLEAEELPSLVWKKPSQSNGKIKEVRKLLSLRGLSESVTFAFLSEKEAGPFLGNTLKPLTLDNPISGFYTTLRPSLLPSLLTVASHNSAKGFHENTLFEVSDVYHGYEAKDQHLFASGIRTGLFSERHWITPSRPVNVFDVKADILALLELFGLSEDALTYGDAPSFYHPYKSATLKLGPQMVLGSFGEIHPKVLKTFDLKGPVVAFEVDLKRLLSLKSKKKGKPSLKLSSLQPVKRDFAFLIPENQDVRKLTKAIMSLQDCFIESVTIFDRYQGDKIEKGYISIALSVTLQPFEKTLTDEELEMISHRILESAHQSTGAILRS